jgi:hypothetical protein
MSPKPRLKELERSLSPRGAIGRWLATVQQYPTDEAYLRSISGTPGWRPPLERMFETMQDAVVRSRGGQNPEVIREAIGDAVGDTAFAYELAQRINQVAAEVADRAGLEARYLDWVARLLERHPSSWQPEDPAADPASDVFGVDWRTWGDLVTWLLDRVAIEEGARLRLEAWAFNRQPSLFPNQAAAWAELRAQLERLRECLETLPPSIRARARAAPVHWPLPTTSVAERVTVRAAQLADDARIVVFEQMGDEPAAEQIRRARLRAATHPAPDEPATGDEPAPPEQPDWADARPLPSLGRERRRRARPTARMPGRALRAVTSPATVPAGIEALPEADPTGTEALSDADPSVELEAPIPPEFDTDRNGGAGRAQTRDEPGSDGGPGEETEV